MRRRVLSSAFATLMVVSMTILNNNIIVNAAETNQGVSITEFNDGSIFDGLENASDLECTDIKYQEPVNISNFSYTESDVSAKIGEKADIDEAEITDFPMAMSDSEIIAGSVSGYLTEASDYDLYSIGLTSGYYFQAQLDTPGNEDIDYDLYLLDGDFNILASSEYYTYLNGTGETLSEALGYIITEDATYYIWVFSSVGGSVSEAYTLQYSISNEYDSFEIDEYAGDALSFTFGSDGAYVSSRNLSSPVDNDWYIITVPSDKIYDKLTITATTESVNTCSVEVYQNAASSGYAMYKVGSGETVSVSTGTYYIRVSNAKTMDEFDETDIQNYTLSITPVLTATDSTTNTTYYAAGSSVTIMYYNPYWEDNNTPSYAYVYAYGTADSAGKYEISVSLPNAIGSLVADSGVSYHYFDLCAIYAYISDNTSVMTYKPIYHLAYTIYHSF